MWLGASSKEQGLGWRARGRSRGWGGWQGAGAGDGVDGKEHGESDGGQGAWRLLWS